MVHCEKNVILYTEELTSQLRHSLPVRSVSFSPIHVDTLFFITMPTLSSCPFHVMALGNKMALMLENKMSFSELTAEAFLIPLDTCSIAPSPFLSRLSPAFQ